MESAGVLPVSSYLLYHVPTLRATVILFAICQKGGWTRVGRQRISPCYGKDLWIGTLRFLVDERVRKNSRPSTSIGNEYIRDAFK